MTPEQQYALDWLNRNRNIHKTISALEERRERMEASINKAVGSYEASEIQFDRDPKRREDKMCEFADLNNLILEKEAELAKIDAETLELIMKLPNTKERFILIERYINHKQFIQIADLLYNSFNHTHRLHRKALTKVYTLLNEKG